jgi:tetratricopeptide (TPR) repeat protein
MSPSPADVDHTAVHTSRHDSPPHVDALLATHTEMPVDVRDELDAVRSGRLPTPEASARQLHFRGVLAIDARQHDVALAYLRAAASSDITSAYYAGELSSLLRRCGRLDEALASSLRALMLEPLTADRYCATGEILTLLRHYRAAELVFAEGARIDGDCSRAYKGLARVCRFTARLQEALRWYMDALRFASDDPDLHAQVAECLVALGDHRAAIDRLRRCEHIHGESADLWVALAKAFLQSGDIANAVEACRAALRVDVHHVQACRYLVCALNCGRRRADLCGAWHCLGVALEAKGRYSDALVAFRQAAQCKPDCLRTLIKLGEVSTQLGQPHDAVHWFDAALAVDPEHRGAHLGLAWPLRLLGDFARGWSEFAWLYRAGDHRRFEQPLWDGSALAGKTILLWADLALGDTIQDLRYVDAVKQRGGRVVVECPRRLVSLVKGMPAADYVVSSQSALPAFDVHAPLRMLTSILGVTRATITQRVPYLAVDAPVRTAWRDRLAPDERTTIGIVWAAQPRGTDARTRSVSLEHFAALARVPGLRLVSLQMGPRAAELVHPPTGLSIEHMLDDSTVVLDTAALMQSLDLIITVDTMTAHLAGALALPVWTLASFSPSWWLWHTDDDRSSWYPTMRIWRQARHGDWQGVFARIRRALCERRNFRTT